MEQTDSESKITRQIRIARQELRRGIIVEELTKKAEEKDDQYFRNEFGSTTVGIKVLRRYLWSIAKLSVLYVAQGINWLIRRISDNRKARKHKDTDGT